MAQTMDTDMAGVRELSRDELLDMLRRMWEIRLFEDKVYDLLGQNIIKGASHLYAGQEAVAVGAIAALRDDDLITSTHRGHGHCHARGDSLAEGAEAKQEHLNKMMAELCGRATGYCKGRGGSMHIADMERATWGHRHCGREYPRRDRCRPVRQAAEAESCGALLLWGWRHQHRQFPRIAQHGRRLEAPRGVCGREQPLRDVGAL